MSTPQEQAEQLFAQSSADIQAGQFETAEARLVEALDKAPQLAEAHANLAWLLERRGSVDDALHHYELAIDLQPDNARIHLNLGALLAQLKFFLAAEAAYRRALVVDASLPGIWSNLGALLAQIGRDDEAEESLRTALRLDPEHAGAHFNLACLLLRKGRYPEGWRHLEFRDWYRPIEQRLRCVRWCGQPLAGLSVLLVYEAGHGDLIQFCRYVPVLRQAGAARVDVLCHPALKELLRTLDGVGDVFAFDENRFEHDWDYWVPALSLAHHLGTELETIPAALPYLRAPAPKLAHWRQKLDGLGPRPGRRVGFVWHGNPDFENDAQRSLPGLQTLAPLWQVPGVQFFSLQKGRGEKDVLRLQGSQPLIDLAADLHNFADTAAAIEQLDLVISVDTAVAHLAGALGKPCWVLLPGFLPDWRWLEDRSDSPWYPGVLRLFRQPRGADWAPVIQAVCEALQEARQSNV
ncbi:MAG TPA: tetratricopeptide repeat protein [Rhodoferax sp.]